MTVDHTVAVAVAVLQFGASLFALVSALPMRRARQESRPTITSGAPYANFDCSAGEVIGHVSPRRAGATSNEADIVHFEMATAACEIRPGPTPAASRPGSTVAQATRPGGGLRRRCMLEPSCCPGRDPSLRLRRRSFQSETGPSHRDLA
jgi:hypothetical protein